MPSEHDQPIREHFDVLIVGAGLSGIGAGAHLQRNCPGKTYAILEAREAIGGTWDLFRYPGIRSGSDMYTLGYAFRPWPEATSIAGGPRRGARGGAPRGPRGDGPAHLQLPARVLWLLPLRRGLHPALRGHGAV